MSMVIVLEIIFAIIVLAVAVRFAVRETRLRRDVSPEQRVESEDTAMAQPRGSKLDAEQDHSAEQNHSEGADQGEGHEVAAVSASSTAAEPPADAR